MTNKRCQKVILLVPRANETIFISSVDFLLLETEATHIFVVFGSVKCARSIQDMLRSVIDSFLLMVLKFEKLILLGTNNFNFLSDFLLGKVPDYEQSRKLK